MPETDATPWMKVPAATVWDIAPGPGAEVTYRGRTAQVIRACSPGTIRGPVDLVLVDGSDLHRDVVHDVANGWAWPGEPPPDEPTPADRLRQAQAAGVFVPPIGSAIDLVCARPKSFRGIVYKGVAAIVEAVHDLIPGPRWAEYLEAARGGGLRLQQFENVYRGPHYRVLLAARVADDADLAGLERVEAGQQFGLVEGPVVISTSEHEGADRPATEGWAKSFRETVIDHPQHNFVHRPCERCWASCPHHQNVSMVRFFADCGSLKLNLSFNNPKFFTRTCLTCAEEISQFACRPIPPRRGPAAVDPRSTQAELDDLGIFDEEDGDGA